LEVTKSEKMMGKKGLFLREIIESLTLLEG
jgi:hypothetical protein